MNKEVAVLLAVYYPNMTFLKQQLRSLNDQTYNKMRIYICDDSANEKEYASISKLVQQELTNKPYILFANAQNLGSTKTFERLTQLAQGDYVAYCDQDDIWETDKIEKQVITIEHTQSRLVYSHLRVINAQNDVISERFSEYNPRIEMVEGENLFSFFVRRNCVTGCSLLMDSAVAKQAMPFHSEYVHDHWLALHASLSGKITCIKESLVQYRLHGDNQIGSTRLYGVENIEDYVPNKLVKEYDKLSTLFDVLPLTPQQKEVLEAELKSIQARIDWFKKPSASTYRALKSFRKEDAQLAKFETVVRLLPKKWANKVIRKIKQ
ncbi:glycosyltransferase [Carnobacteriaceae bacterium zg-C25]|nr:glycosyltransferase [Carnobacteriaceae bacterium zg-C25]